MRLVPVNSIKPGSYLAKDIYDKEGRTLLAKGVELSPLILNRVKKSGIISLYIQDEYSKDEIQDVIQPELRQKAIHLVKEYMDFTKVPPKNINTKLKEQYQHIQTLYKIAENIVDEILNQKNVLINLVDIKNMDNYTYAHCVNVAILSLILGKELNFNKKQLLDLAVGGMLHDIGKIFVPNEVLNKKGKLDKKEYEIIKEHPENGYSYLKDSYDINAYARIIILQHHEKIDGTGYPKGLKQDEIHLYAKIAAIADVYDALTSDRCYRRGHPPNEALEFIMGSAGQAFDFSLVKAFVSRIIPYPIGTLVKLSNGCTGVIENINPSFSLRPEVKIIEGNEDYKMGELIDLYDSNNSNITINNVVY